MRVDMSNHVTAHAWIVPFTILLNLQPGNIILALIAVPTPC